MYLEQEPSEILRRFVAVGDRLVHYRRAGSGPPVVLLHQSPTSSAELASQILHFARDFTVIAPDTPGYGLSGPLPLARPEMADYAEALAAFLDTLGLGRVGVYGTHTGAMIAAEFAQVYPRRTGVAVLDGYVVLTAAERADFLRHYFVDVPPEPDGRHLVWYWSRIRDQTIFFPWYRKTRDARMRFDVPPAAMLQPFLLDLLRADRLGTPAYAAAFRYPADARARAFTAPTYLLNYHADAIAHHPERLGALPASVRRERLPDPDALLGRASALFAEAGGMDAPPPPPPPQPAQCRFLDTRHGPLLVRSGGEGVPLLLLHASGASSAQWEPLMERGGRLFHAPDLPGHGGSPRGTARGVDDWTDVFEGLLDQLDSPPAVLALEGSGWLALGLKARRPDLRLTLVDLPMPGDDGGGWPDLAPRDDGGHLLAAWRAVRDGELFRPWDRPDLAYALAVEPDLAPERLHARTVDLLLAAQALPDWERSTDRADASLLTSAGQAGLRIAWRDGLGAGHAAHAAAALAGTKAESWPRACADWGPDP